MSVHREQSDGSLELISPDYSEGDIVKLREELDKVEVPVAPTPLIQPIEVV